MKVLITPLGSSTGSLNTALEYTRPQVVHVVSSAQMWCKHGPGLLQAHPELHWRVILLKDPFAGFLEGRFYARLLGCQYHNTPVTVNLTGGTTALQDCVRLISLLLHSEEIATTCDRKGKPQVHVLRPALEGGKQFPYHEPASVQRREGQV